ncbi:MAG: MATE family efflux transporter [Lachnospiraceae bacterium]|jgi:putative MATE family efflux protein|nr:MATE family efflux transporter [Lachnospiraceae bacterium]
MTKKMTSGSPAKLIIAFTLPLLIGNIFQQLYSMADTWIVGRTLGVNALAAVGSTGSLTFFIIGLIQGLTSGLTIITANRFGAGDEEGVRKSFGAGIWITFIFSIIIMVFTGLFTRQILEMMRTPEAIIDGAYKYLIIIFLGILATSAFNLLSNVIRALGDSKTPLIFLVVACIVNIILDFGFILVLHTGVEGAAYATIIAQLVSDILCVIYIIKKLPILHIKPSDFKVSKHDLEVHIKLGLPMGFQVSIIAIGAIILQIVLNGLGTVAVAGYTAAQKIDQIAVQPMNSFGLTMATYTAQNYGAGKIKRIKSGVFQCVLISVSFAICIGLVNVFLGYQLSGFFVSSAPKVLRLSQTYLQINGALYVILSLLFILRNTIQGLGSVIVPTLAGIMELIMRTFAAIILAKSMGFAGVSWASPLAWAGALIPVAIFYFYKIRQISLSSKDTEL